jgi:ABC-type nitrate/sulfonate/bicarbonate transport system ATPase subunit
MSVTEFDAPTAVEPHIQITRLEKQYLTSEEGLFRRIWRVSRDVIEDLNLAVDPLEFVSIVGPSGCGKTTLMNMLAGLTEPSSGSITIGGERLYRPRPKTAVVFQEVGLFPWRSVLDNVLLGVRLQNHRRPNAAERERAQEYLELVGLGSAAEMYPWQLSGGMRQRVGIARALVTGPDLLLMDEPFGALDAQTRLTLQKELLRICDEYRATVVFITHDVDEAVLLSDRILVMRNGGFTADIATPLGAENRRTGEIQSSERFAALRAQVLEELGL